MHHYHWLRDHLQWSGIHLDPSVVMAGDTSRSHFGLNLTKSCSQIFALFQNNLHICYHIYTIFFFCWKHYAPQAVIPQSHRPNRYETNTKPTINVKFAYKLVWIRYWLSVSKNCRLPVRCICWCGVTSVRKRLWTCRFSFGHRWHMVCWFSSVMHWEFVGWHSTDSRPIQDRTRADRTANCGESANIVPTQDRHVRDMSGTQT